MNSEHYDPQPLIRARKAKGWSVEEAAEAMKTNHMALYRVERGNGNVSIDKLKAICEFYGIALGAILRDEFLFAQK